MRYALIIVIVVIVRRAVAARRGIVARCIAELRCFLRRFDLLAELSSKSAVVEDYEQEEYDCHYERYDRSRYGF